MRTRRGREQEEEENKKRKRTRRGREQEEEENKKRKRTRRGREQEEEEKENKKRMEIEGRKVRLNLTHPRDSSSNLNLNASGCSFDTFDCLFCPCERLFQASCFIPQTGNFDIEALHLSSSPCQETLK